MEAKKNLRLPKNKQTFVAFHSLCCLSVIAAESQAETYDYSAVVTLCTDTCDDFVSMTVGSTVSGSFEINVGLSDTFGDADIASFHPEINNPTNPPGDPPTDPTTENPLILESGMGRAVSNGTAGTTGAVGELNGGQILLELLIEPLSSNGAYLVFDLATGDGQLCLSFTTSDCMPGSTEAMKFEGSFSLPPGAGFTVGGDVSGLAPGNSLTLQNNDIDDLILNAKGPFEFETELADGSPYDVTVSTQPSGKGQTCSVTNGSGTISGANVSNVSVSCVTEELVFANSFE